MGSRGQQQPEPPLLDHDSELTAAVVDEERDLRAPADPGGLGDGARRFARELRLELMREHLGRDVGDDEDLLDLATAVSAMLDSAAALDGWHRAGGSGPRPPGRLRLHQPEPVPTWGRRLAASAYSLVYDPDGRPLRERLRG